MAKPRNYYALNAILRRSDRFPRPTREPAAEDYECPHCGEYLDTDGLCPDCDEAE